MTKIEWTDITWNPITGCSPVSEGCYNCYAKKMHDRLHHIGLPQYKQSFEVVACHNRLLYKMDWPKKKHKKIFICSMSDLFHKDVPDNFISLVFGVIKKYEQHTFQILTKRSGRMLTMSQDKKFPDNLWVGVSAENNNMFRSRVSDLIMVRHPNKFISIEPLLERIDIESHFAYFEDRHKKEVEYEIGWIIAGGETGDSPRLAKTVWFREIRDFCYGYRVPFFFKQFNKKGDNVLDGRSHQQFPEGM